MDTAVYIFAGLLLAIIVLAFGIPVLVKMTRAPKGARSGNKVSGLYSRLKNMKVGIRWWLWPLILWVAIHTLLWYYFPHFWGIIWRKQLLFWILQASHWALVWHGHGHYYDNGRPERPAYPGVLFMVFWVLLGCAFIWGQHDPGLPPSNPAKPAVTAPAPPTQAPKAAPIPKEEQQLAPPEPLQASIVKVDIVALPETDGNSCVVYVPQGYHIIAPDEWEKVAVCTAQDEQSDKRVRRIFVSKSSEPVSTTVRFEATIYRN